ncbi:MAG: hypothetical protein R3B13_18720 [Polyangiaceae bacterium]
MSDAERKQRAEARRQRMVIAKAAFGVEPRDDVVGAPAVSLATQLSRTAWALSGRPFPGYSRSEIPIRFVARD